jgi:diguanylate cyclase (GGDEF)-like protein
MFSRVGLFVQILGNEILIGRSPLLCIAQGWGIHIRMAHRPLSSFAPTAGELLSLDLPRLGRILLLHLKTYEGLRTVMQNGRLNRDYFVAMLENRSVGLGSLLRKEPEYGPKTPEVVRALLEAWNWLEREGLLIRDPEQPADWFAISRRGEELLKHVDRFERWEILGLDRVKSDLIQTGGIRDIGGPQEVRDLAWQWVKMKEGQAIPTGEQHAAAVPTELEKIPGKAAMLLEVQQSLEARKLAAVLYMDLDGFKQVNDTLGHTKGDECLITVARAMGNVLLNKGKLYRPGGDEFVAILSNFNGVEATAVAERIRAAVDATDPGGELKVTVSIGVTSSDLTDLRNPKALIDLADKAMYRAKQVKNCVVSSKDLADPANEADKMNIQTETREQHTVTAAYYPRFQKIVHDFEEFVDSRANNTLHYIIVGGGDFSSQMRDDLCKALGAVPVGMWSSLLHFFKLRIDRTPPSFEELIAGVQEFHHLLAQFNNLCMAPIFDHLPNDKRAALTELQRSRLNGFQQRFTFYLRDYMAFGKELSQTLPELQHLPRDIPYSNPL